MLLEREAPLGNLAQCLAEAAAGRGSLVLVAGEAGSGKTSLVRAFTESQSATTVVLVGACDPLTTPRPLSPLHDFAADSTMRDVDVKQEPMEVFVEILDRIRHTIRPVVMVVEDIHWADAATLDFLRFVGRRVSETKAMLVCTYRDDEMDADHPTRRVLGQLIPLESTLRLQVPPLSLEAVTRLAGESQIEPSVLMRLTDGNAFFVTEILTSGEGLPATVQEAVLARVAHLAERPRRVVEGVSIAPRSLEIPHAVSMVEGSLDDIDEALAAGVLVSDGHTLRFRHELARSAVEESLPSARRLGLHLRMLEILGEDPSPDLARLAHHAIKAGRSDLVVEHAPPAGDEAARAGARREAVAFYRAALEHPDELGPDEVARLQVKLGSELRLLDEPVASEAELRRAIDRFRAAGHVEELADALGLLQATLWNLRRFDEGWEAMNEAIELLRPLGPSEPLGMALYRIAHHHMLSRHASPALAHAEEARLVGEQTGSDNVQWLSSMIEGTIHVVTGDADRGVRMLTEAVAEADRLQNPRLVTIGLGMLGSGGGESRRYPAAVPALERSVESGLATDEDYSVAYDRSWLARVAFEQGRWNEAVEYAELVDRTTQQREGIAYITALSALGRVRVRRGDPGGVVLLEEMTALAREHELQHGWNAICGRTEHFWLSGRAEEGSDELVPAYRRALDTDSPWARGEIGFWMWRTGRISGPPDRAAEPFALQMAGQWEEAAERWRDIGCPYEVAMALGDGPPDAQLEAIEILDRLGARPLGDRVRSALRARGVDHVPPRPTDRTLANPAGLTGRQLEVLSLIVEGYGNDEIASKLYISKKTVEHHVSAIYAKLGVTNRAEAARTASHLAVTNRGTPSRG